MRRARHSVLLRLLTLVLLLRIGFDFGAHGFFVCDFTPIPPGCASAARIAPDEDASPTVVSPDHCFCHALSVGAVAPARVAVLTLVGSAVTPLPVAIPVTTGHPLDQPPRTAA